MPKTREQIKHEAVAQEVWRDNRTQVGGLWFDPLKVRPLGDHILIQLDDDTPPSKVIAAPQTAVKEIGTRIGTVIAVGPGKWKTKYAAIENGKPISWVQSPLIFKPVTLRPGDRVTIGHYSDWESWSCDYEGRGRNVALCQEADVRVVLN
jgi:hypothetical protein